MQIAKQFRISIFPPLNDHAPQPDRSLVIGQKEAMGEALFFLRLGYSVKVDELQGGSYVNEANYYPDDL